jgi:hypothetical protein
MRFASVPLAVCLSLALWQPVSAADPTSTYTDPQYGFSLHYPANARIETNGQGDGQLEMTDTTAVVVTPNLAAFAGTNLGEASVAVGVGTNAATVTSCGSGATAQGEKTAGSVTLGGIKFARFTFEDAGAGNRYASTVYRAVSGGTCYEIVEFLHWAAIENFPPGKVKDFDRAKIDAVLHVITRSFTLTGKPT